MANTTAIAIIGKNQHTGLPFLKSPANARITNERLKLFENYAASACGWHSYGRQRRKRRCTVASSQATRAACADCRNLAAPTSRRLALRPAEAAVAMGISQGLLKQCTDDGTIPCLRLHRAILYSIDVLRQTLREHSSASARLDNEIHPTENEAL